jgi:hypothetical protein
MNLTNHGWQRTMTKVGKSDGEGTFAGTRGNGIVAPKPARRWTAIEPRESTHYGQHMGWRLEAR